MSKVIGIDLGTTNSCVAIMEGKEPTVIPNAEGNRTTASVVAFQKNGERLVGQVAKRQAVVNADRTISSIKRKMGTNEKIKIDDKTYTPQEISAMILTKLKQDAESYLGQKVTQAVITTPAYFSDSQRQATKDAGKIAGLEVLRIINEPTAAALAYGLDKAENKDQKILVYDLGGGTFDVSILEIGDGVFEVLATSGNTQLGGDDFDKKIVDWMVAEFKAKEGVDLTNDKAAMQRLKESAEKAKIDLSGVLSSNISIPYVTANETGPKHLDMTLTRQKFNSLTESLVNATKGPTLQALKDAKLEPNQINKVILVGGSTRIPAVADLVKGIMGKEPFKGINPDECVAVGAAIQAGVLAGDVKDVLLLDVTPLSLGIETMGGIATKLIPRNTTIPVQKSQIFSTAADMQSQVDIHVLQGEREFSRDNKTLGRFELTGIPPAPRGVPQIEVTFNIDANGIVSVTAEDKATKKKQALTITASSNLSDADIDKAIKDAEQFAEEDKKRKEVVDAKNDLDHLIFTVEKFMKESGDKLSSEDQEKIKADVEEAKKHLSSEDAGEIKDALNKFRDDSAKVFEKMYQQTGGEAPGPDFNQDGGNTEGGEFSGKSTDANTDEPNK